MYDDWDENCVVVEAPKPMVFTNSSHGHKEQQPWNDSDWGSDSASSASYNRDFGGGSRGGNRGGGFRGGNRDRNDSRGGNRDWGDRGGNREWGDRGGNRDSGDRGGNRDWSDRKSSQAPRRSDNDGNATIIKVPSRFVGRIIGRGGSKINDLQFESGARINVTKETEGEETIVRLSGDDSAVAKAESLIRDLTVDRDNYRGNTGDRDNYRGNNVARAESSMRDLTIDRDNHRSHESEANRPSQDPPPMGGAEKPKIIDWGAFLKECDDAEKAFWDKLPPIKKDFYTEHPEITALPEDQVEDFRKENNNIVVERTFKKDDSKPVPKPVISFHHAFHQFPEIIEEIRKAGFAKPSPIQCQAWPVLLSGEDLIGIAQTGTGKTLAFLLPALIHINGQVTARSDRAGPAVLVMAPTRELALQIDKEVKKYEYKGINAVCIYGGGNRREQISTVTRGVDIVIATPGRLNDLVEAGHLDVRYVTYVVLDEADRMLDMGFEPQIRKVMYSIRPTRQTVMTSATWPLGVRRLAQSYMDDPIQVYVGTLDLAAVHTVTQIIEIMPDDDSEKFKALMEFAHNLSPEEKVIVFCGKKSRADEIASELTLLGISCQTIHGDREQSDREQALLDIADGTVQILVATDVASRGLDIDDISHVINYDFPRNIEEYVHRVGRTGRAGKSGKSISYFTRGDWGQAKEIISILEEAQQYVPEEIYKMAERHAAWKEKKDADRPSGGRRFGGNRGGNRW